MLKPLHVFLAALAASSTVTAYAALRPTTTAVVAPAAIPTPVDRALSVSGSAEVKVVPDVANVRLTVDVVRTANAADAQAAATTRAAELLSAVQKVGVDKADVRSEGFNVQPEWRYDATGRAVEILRWRATRDVVVCVHDLGKLQDVVNAALAGGPTARLGDVTYDTTRLTELRKEARLLAVRAAREKARAMTDELGVQLGPPRSIAEGADGWSGAYQVKNAFENAGGEGIVDGAFAPGRMVVSAQVSVTFDVVP